MPIPERDLVAALRTLSIPEELIERAVERGDPGGAIFDSAFQPWRAERTVSVADIEATGVLDAADVHAMADAAGLPLPARDEPAFTREEADVLVTLGRVRDIWPEESTLQLLRLYGRLLSRIAQASVQLFETQIDRRLLDEDRDPLALAGELHSALERLLPLGDPLLLGVYRRSVERSFTQRAVRALETRTGTGLPGSVEVAFLFCDLKDYTAFSVQRGDEAAVEAIDRFVAVISAERGKRCHFQKLLGDGAMLAYDHAAEAVGAGARIIAGMNAPEMPGVHASAHHGIAIMREGDYFGSTVNIAARLLAVAGRDELVTTRETADACGDGFAWEPAGARAIRGVREPVEVLRLAPNDHGCSDA